MSLKEQKLPLSIRLTEPVVFLRAPPDVGRRRHDAAGTPPAMLRGLLTLHLTKPTRVSSIEIELEGKCIVLWPEGSGHRRVDIPEETNILSARTVFFSAKTLAISARSASLGPSTRGLDDDDEHPSRPGTARSSRHFQPRLSFDATPGPPAVQPSSSLTVTSHAARRNSSDQYGWQRGVAGPNTAATLSAGHPHTPPASPPYTPEPGYSPLLAEVQTSRPQTPTDQRLEGSSQQHYNRKEESPGQMLEEYRNVLQMELGSTVHPFPSCAPPGPSSQFSEPTLPTAESSMFRLRSAVEVPARSMSAPSSRSTSRDAEHREERPPLISTHRPSPSRSRPESPSTPPALTPSLRVTLPPFDHEHEHSPRGRHSPRWSLSNMSSVFKDVKDMVRNSSPKETDRHRGRSPVRSGDAPLVDFVVGLEERERRRQDKERMSTIGKLTAAVKLDEIPNSEHWKEFRKGTYTYPISFAIPSNTPPTLHSDYGAVTYRLKAVVHRPGALTSKLAISTEVTLVASPGDDDTEDTHSIVVERQWDAQLRYLIALNGRSFPIGCQVPFHLTMIPLEKCKVYRLSVVLEEKTEYFRPSSTAKREHIKRFQLLSIKHTDKNSPPILPLCPESAALLTPYLDTSSPSSTDEALSSLMGPGPWILSHDLQIPAQCGRIRFTYKHKNAQISVHHLLKIVFRVERSDDLCVDPRTGKRRLFDIIVQTPITILSCHCNPEQIALPRYSLFAAGTSVGLDGAAVRTCGCSGWSVPLTMAGGRTFASSGPVTANSRPSTADSIIQNAERVSSGYQFARLVAGQEGVRGEAPPEYTELLAQGR